MVVFISEYVGSVNVLFVIKVSIFERLHFSQDATHPGGLPISSLLVVYVFIQIDPWSFDLRTSHPENSRDRQILKLFQLAIDSTIYT